MSGGFDPLHPRDVDLPTRVPLKGDLSTGDVAISLDDAKIFAAPADAGDLVQWRLQLTAWRDGARKRHGEPTRYNDGAAAWASRCFTVAQVWLWDELFFDFEAQRFTPERFLADARERFGGLDGIVLWHAYPVIGIDDRNQWDYYNVPGLADVSAALRRAGVAVFLSYMPWDIGTRRSGDDAAELTATVRRLGADSVFLDTLKKADRSLVAALDAARPGIGLEGESKLSTDRIADHTLSWAQWFADSEVPGVLRARWFERRHMQHHIRRWHRDHAEELRAAWLNGVGVLVWEVVFGAWVGWNDRDSATLRRMVPVQRGFHRWLVDGEWTPLTVTEGPVVGSSFDLDGVKLLLLANTSDTDAKHQLAGTGWDPLHPGDTSEVVTVPANGIAAAVQVSAGAAVPGEIAAVQTALAGEPAVRNSSFRHRRARRLSAPPWPGPAAPAAFSAAAVSAVTVPAGEYTLTVRYRMRETGMYGGAPYVDEWKPLSPRLHDQRTLDRFVTLPRPVHVAAEEVSEAEYARFLDAVGEHAEARDPERPATKVTLARAREYAAWAGGRLPSEDEWQLAAADPGFRRRTPEVWNWTESEHSDGRTRFVMLKGGSAHRSRGSNWYFDGGLQPPEFTAKLLLPGLELDASASIGFRICRDQSDDGGGPQ
ncbi:SUMF1/EgtB/PvdO family nonheme iron enzyme [Arthrobacter sp. zg-Y1143]|uniref:SUMF1/EgtB/PvdO family nonheme iron enzyme n=1 Tax=Arthrobacter sp. zg-Y1143 TaxID=3049065 RepID=UPI0024C2C329|nr:SUMF1/EgtB/PvdO family nonheme iron enzyme [Arthrobacter sp. zg-Y1143]MDK1326468.1 SUMF1/EgtB/PvdO family nonheme iron enzyme [Arthrobacter sp. zg-Y1143]